jgi:hypothetical protein
MSVESSNKGAATVKRFLSKLIPAGVSASNP